MAERVDLDPEVLRRLAVQHDQVADDITRWSEPPYEWLGKFQETYGTIADKVREALHTYYHARQQAGLSLAGQHRATATSLRQAALDFERSEHEGSALVKNAMNPDGPSAPGSPAPFRPVTAPGGPHDSGPSATAPGADGNRGSGVGTGPQPAGAPATAGRNDSDEDSNTAVSVPPNAGDAPRTTTSTGPDPASTAAAAAPAQAQTHLPAAPGGSASLPGVSAAGETAAPARNTTASAGEGAGPVAVPITHPMAAAVTADRDRESGTGHVVNESVNEDLVLARALLGAVLAAADSAAFGLSWAVAVLRGTEGVAVFLTSNEGRGWLPAGLYPPEEISSPWAWDEVLGTEVTAAWEGIADPARMLAEFARVVGAGTGTAFTALASSTTIDAGLRTALPDVAMADAVGPAYDVDLREPKPGTADRLALTRSASALEIVAAVPDSRILQYCVERAVQVHDQLAHATVVPAQVHGVRGARASILATLTSGGEVSAQQWQDLRDADDLLAATILAHRVDTGRVALGDLRPDSSGDTLRAMVFERRASELLLLLEAEPTRQTLRDAVYAYEQVVAHPRFTLPLAPITTVMPDRVDAPVTAPVPSVVTAAPAGPPPSGATASPDGAMSSQVSGR